MPENVVEGQKASLTQANQRQFFCVIAQSPVLDQSLSHAAFRLLAVIQVCKNSTTNRTTIGLEYLAAQMGYTGSNRARSISALVKELEGKGYVTRESGTGLSTTSFYHPLDAFRPDRHRDHGGEGSANGGGGGNTLGGGNSLPRGEGNTPSPSEGITPPILVQPFLDKKLTQGTVDLDDSEGFPPSLRRRIDLPAKKPEPVAALAPATQPAASFDAFWKAYPRKIGKPQAFKAWSKSLQRAGGLPAILAALKAACNQDHRFRDLQFTPHPASWLNSDPWDNSYARPAPGGLVYVPNGPRQGDY